MLSDVDGAEQGTDYDAAGRIDMALLSRVLPFNDYDFYLCGPPPMVDAVRKYFDDAGVKPNSFHYEKFTPNAAPNAKAA